MFRVLRPGVVALLIGSPLVASLQAQSAPTPPSVDLGGTVAPGSEREHYLRVLQLVGAVPTYPWTVQPFGFREMSRIRITGDHPWSARFAPTADSAVPPARFTVLRPRARLFFNSSVPERLVNGPTWTGRGLTADAEGGVLWRWSGVALQMAPSVFLAQNTAFDLVPNRTTGIGAFRDPRWAGTVDLPQRFGDKSYGRFDGGESQLSFEFPGVAFGASTAVQRWGPGYDAGLVLSPNAGGVPHIYLGSSTPLNALLFDLQWRMEFGNQPASALAAPTAHPVTGFSGLVLTVVPHGLTGLEFGLTRWSEFWMPPHGLGLHEITRPFVSGSAGDAVGAASPNVRGENQVASAFMRWAIPGSGLEVYGEIYREDWAQDFRDILERPDDLAALLIGTQYARRIGPDAIRVFRAELINGELSAQERVSRGFTYPLAIYTHTEVLQGHTTNGMLLGSDDAYNGAAARLTMEDYTPSGRRSIMLFRQVKLDWTLAISDPTTVQHPAVAVGVKYELVRFGKGRDYTFTVIPSYELNHNLEAGKGLANLALGFGVRGWR